MQNKPRRLGSDVYTCEYKSAVAVCEACTIETEAQKSSRPKATLSKIYTKLNGRGLDGYKYELESYKLL